MQILEEMESIKLGLDCPTGLLDKVQPLADYDYVLVDKASQDPIYLDYFKRSKRPKILNNRILMKWDPVPLDEMREIWNILGGEVIAPDWMWDSKKTFESYEGCCKVFGEENVIGVMQGITQEDIDACLKLYGEKVAIPFDVGSPKQASAKLKVERRVELVHRLKGKKIQLLGLTLIRELEFYRWCPPVVSLNTGLPIMLALEGKSIRGYEEDKKNSSYHGMDMDYPPISNQTLRLLEDNIVFIKWLLEVRNA